MALVAPAGPLDPDRIDASADRCRELGLDPVVYPHARDRTGYLAGADENRLADLQEAIDDPATRAVWALRGGYGTLRIIDALVLERQLRDPIPYIGFSDNTSVHVRHAEIGVVSIHGPHPSGARSDSADVWLRRMLFEAEAAGSLPVDPDGPEPRGLVEGVAEGPLIGGNLAILAAMCGTRHTPTAAGAILFLEDVGEPAYRIDRMLLQLEGSGVLDGIVGLAFGRFTEGGSDGAVEAVLAEYAERIGVPTVLDLPFGHIPNNHALPVGVRARLDAGAATLSLIEPAVDAMRV